MMKHVRALSTITQWATRKYSPHVAIMNADRKPVRGPKSIVPRKNRERTPAKENMAEGIRTILSEGPPSTLKTAAIDA